MNYYKEQLEHLRCQLGAMMDEITIDGNVVKITLKEESMDKCGDKTASTQLRERDLWARFYRSHLITWQDDYICPGLKYRDDIFQEISILGGRVTIKLWEPMRDKGGVFKDKVSKFYSSVTLQSHDQAQSMTGRGTISKPRFSMQPYENEYAISQAMAQETVPILDTSVGLESLHKSKITTGRAKLEDKTSRMTTDYSNLSLRVLLKKLWSLCYTRIHRTLLGAYAHQQSRLIHDHAFGVILAALNDERLHSLEIHRMRYTAQRSQLAGYFFPKISPKSGSGRESPEQFDIRHSSVEDITSYYKRTLVHLMHQLDTMMNEIVIEGKVVKVTLKGVILDKERYEKASPESSEKAAWAELYKCNLLLLKKYTPKYIDAIIEDVAICDGEVVITLTERMKNMDFLLDKLWSLCYIRIHRSLWGAYLYHGNQPEEDQSLGVVGSVLQLLEEFEDSDMLAQVLSTEHKQCLCNITTMVKPRHWEFSGLKFLAEVDSGHEDNKLDSLQKLSKKNTRHASIQVSVDATDAETQSDLQFCEISYDIKLTTESDFVICGLNTEFPLAVYIPRDTISTQDEAAMTVTITCNMTQQQCNSEDDDVQDIGPTLSFTPHRYNFLRPILVFMYLPDRYQTKEKDHEYAVLYSNTDRDEEPIWEDVTGFDHYPVSGVVIPLSNLAILRFTHFCSSKVVVQPSEKACVANVFAFVDHACRDVRITCLLCPERHTGQRRYEDSLARIKGSLEESKVFLVSNNNSPVSLNVTRCDSSWKIEDEADQEQERRESTITSNVVAAIKELMMSSEQEHESKNKTTTGTAMREQSEDQQQNEPKQLTSSNKEKPQNSHSQMLEKKLVELMNNIQLGAELWTHPRSKGVVTPAQHHQIEAVRGQEDQTLQLLDIVKKSTPELFSNFCEALKATKQHHIVSEYLTPSKDSTEADFSKENVVALLKMVHLVFKSKPFLEIYSADDDLEGLQKQLMCLLKQKEQETWRQS